MASPTIAASRVCCRFHFQEWVAAFSATFPRRAFKAESLALQLAGESDALTDVPLMCDGNADDRDPYHQKRSLPYFAGDRQALAKAGIRLAAADVFLNAHPFGCASDAHPQPMPIAHGLLPYYDADEPLPDNFNDHLSFLEEHARGALMDELLELGRLDQGFIPMACFRVFFKHMGWDFAPSSTDDGIPEVAPLIRLGTIQDPELGDLQCFHVPTYFYPTPERDQLAVSVAELVANLLAPLGSDGIIFFNRPLALVSGNNSFTAIGAMLTGSRLAFLFVPAGRHAPLSELFVLNSVFTPNGTPELADPDRELFNRYWSLLNLLEPERKLHVRVSRLGDGWVIPAE